MHVNGQLRFAGLEQLASDPVTSLFEGRVYWNTATKILRIYNKTNSRWENSNKIENLAADPVTNLYAGRLYYNTVSNQLRVYDAELPAWVEISFPTVVGNANKNLRVNEAADGVEWSFKGSLEQLAVNPVANLYQGRTYWNTAANDPRIFIGVAWLTFGIPDVTGNSGLYLFTDGITAVWASAIAGTLPIQTGNEQKFLQTDGTLESWQHVQPQFNVSVNDNQVAELNITGLVYDKTVYNGVKLGYVIDRTDGATPRSTIGEFWLRFHSNNNSWDLHRANEFGDFPGVTFIVNAAGQVRYTSDSMGGTYSGNMKITQIATMGNI